MITKPMLAAKVEDETIDKLRYPLLATPKIDGIRCLKLANGRVVSRSFKPIVNDHIRQILQEILPCGADGEIYLPYGEFNQVSSAVMRRSGKPRFRYAMFDLVRNGTEIDDPYWLRMDQLKRFNKSGEFNALVDKVIPQLIQNYDQLLIVEQFFLENKFEGIMLRNLNGLYKCGRSTFREGGLLKLKRFRDSEARIIGVEALQSNQNEATTDAFGHTKRSSHQANQVTQDKLGSLLVQDLYTNVEFSIGSGFDDSQRFDYWINQNAILGKIVKYRYQSVGQVIKPRFPTFLGFRSEDDI